MALRATKINEKIKKGRRVFKYENLPWRNPTISQVVWALLLDRLGAPGWIWGVFFSVLVMWWAVWIHAVTVTYVFVDAFPKDRDESHHWPATHEQGQKEKVH